ncbi:S8 family serine peptidase [Halosolutus gelatinilyticus]|uniref:S8 family serine peptidase n=1 Tax=Halosolutus gelatinilyticus TaxID=2931975 RepID=UPI001FF29455|nr:S8 family serine peptidase [Halosolutus gelatinilyticus]
MAAGAGAGDRASGTTDDYLEVSSLEMDRIDEALQDADGTTEMVVRFERAEVVSTASEEEAVGALKTHAAESQKEAIRWAKETDGVTVENEFWIANAILLEVDTAKVSPEEVARYTGAEAVHKNFELEITGGPSADSESADAAADESVRPTAENVTYGLDMINATEVWEQHGTKGGGAGVAILDTGVDADHPDLEIDPDNWQEFDDSGEPIESEPNDGNGHGTHVSGTVTGSDNPEGDVPVYGVAPEAELYHGKVLSDAGGGSFAQILAGMEWAVNDTDADIISMSLGATGYYSELIEPSENARDAGVVLVSSAGNSGQGTSGSPGNVYPNFASGAVDESGQVASFSSGEVIDTESAFPDAPEYWPDEFVVPNAAAPGVNVLSSVPGGGYDDTYSGTSMSAPHKAGAFALMIAASGGDADRDLLYDALEQTAWQPDGGEEPNTEYGHGIIDVAAATNMVALDSGINGTVTAADGTPIDDATVDVDGAGSTVTDDDGQYSLVAPAGEYTVTADAFGYEAESATVTVEEEETTVQNFDLADALDVELVNDQPEGVEGGDTVEVNVTAANVETVTVDLGGDYNPENATLYVDGEETEFGETVDFGGPISDDLTIAVETTEDTEGELALEHTFTGMGDEHTIATGPTMVFEEYVPVAVVDDAGSFGDDIAAVLEDELPALYDPVATTSDEAKDGYDVIVVQNLATGGAEEFIEATDGGDTGVVYLDQWGSDSNALPVHSDVTGEPASTYENDFVSPPVGYELTADHQIFAGVGEAGDTVDIHTGSFGDHTWFDGTDFDVLAETSAEGVAVGSGFAVDDGSATVFASSLGYSAFVGSGDYTDDADTILANAVEYLAEPRPSFQVEVTETNEPVIEGENLTVGATVENVGSENGTQNVTLADFDGDVVDSTALSLDEGEAANVSLSWETNTSDIGTGNVTVASEDDAVTRTVTVHEEPDGLLTFGDGDYMGIIDETVTVEINTTAEAVAGYETQVRFDPAVLQVEGVNGVDFDDPVSSIDNENGTLSIAAAQAGNESMPTLAEVEFAVVGDSDDAAKLIFDEENTFLNDAESELTIMTEDGTVTPNWLGDVNGDDDVNTLDATLTQQYIVGDEPTGAFNAELADMDRDGEVNAGDVILILEEIVEAHGPNAIEA